MYKRKSGRNQRTRGGTSWEGNLLVIFTDIIMGKRPMRGKLRRETVYRIKNFFFWRDILSDWNLNSNAVVAA